MDLLNTVRKEGSRGGRADFKWTDVQADQHRENYLGHSLMAPVGRWQRGKDLQWYARKDEDGDEDDSMTPEERAQKERQEEIARIKQAEREALNKALGYEVNPEGPLGQDGGSGANATAVQGDRVKRCPERKVRNEKREHKHRHRERSRDRPSEHRHRRHHERSRSREHRHREKYRARSVSRDRPAKREHDHRRRSSPGGQRHRSRSVTRNDVKRDDSRDYKARSRSRSPAKYNDRGGDREPFRRHGRSHRRRSRSP